MVSATARTPRSTPAPAPYSQFGVSQAGSGRAEYLTGPVSALRPKSHAWLQLAERCGADPSFHPDTQLAFLETFLPDADVVMVNVSRTGQLIGTLPLVKDRARMIHVPVRRLRAPGHQDSPDRFDILCAGEDVESVVHSVWDTLAARDDWDVIELVDLPAGGPGWRMLDLARADGFGVGHRVSRTTPVIPLDPALSVEQNLSTTDAKFRTDVRRCRRNLEKLGHVHLVRRTTFDSAHFTRFLNMEHAGWKGRNGSSILSDPLETAYYVRLARATAENGSLLMYSLECAGDPIAMHFGWAVGGRYAVPKLTYDENRRSYAPGQLLVWAILEDLLARGATEFDFLGDPQPWKEKWTARRRVHYRAHIFNRTVAGRLARAARYDVAPAAKQIAQRFSHQLSGFSSWVRPHAQEEFPQ